MRTKELGSRLAVVVIAGLFAPACDGAGAGPPLVDGGTDGPDAQTDASGPPVADVAPTPDFGPLPVAAPLPTGLRPHRFLGPDDQLSGDGESSCSQPDPTAQGAARWCSFYRPGVASKTTELWVINVTKAATGAVPPCDGTSSDCRRLTTSLWTSLPLIGPGHPYDHAFQGETLIFYADSSSTGQMVHHGQVSAWRPGWAEPRVLTSTGGLVCFAHARRPLVYCLDNIAGDPMRPDSFEILIGSVAEPPQAPLPSLGRIRPFSKGGALAWRAEFSPDGETFAISSPDLDPEVETLRVIATKDLGAAAPKEILRGVARWAIADDSRRIYFTRPESPETKGLYAVEFPSGADEQKLSGDIRDYYLAGAGGADEGVVFRNKLPSGLTAFRFLRQSRMPASAVTLFSYRFNLEGVHMSPDLRYTAWLDDAFNARVVTHSDLGSCPLNIHAAGSAYEPLFSGSGGMVFWNEDLGDGGPRDAYFARPEDCGGKARFASGIVYYTPLGDRGLVYTDELDNDGRGALKYVPMTKTGTSWGLGTVVRVQAQVENGNYTLLGSPPSLVLYRTRGTQAGTWVFGPLPF